MAYRFAFRSRCDTPFTDRRRDRQVVLRPTITSIPHLDDCNHCTAFAPAYSVAEISIFGSSVRDDITDDSDIDLLVTFTHESTISLFDLIDLEQQLAELFGRPVDIVEPASLKNPIRRHEILSTKQPLYAA